MKAKVRFHLRPVEVEVEYPEASSSEEFQRELENDDSYFESIGETFEIDRMEVLS